MVALLDDHVEVVNFNTLSQMAIDSHKAGLADQYIIPSREED